MKNSFIDKKAKKKFLDDLQQRFLDGVYLTDDEMILEFYNPKTELAIRIAKDHVNGLKNTMKARFDKIGKWFGCVDADGRFGLIGNEKHSEYMNHQYRKRIKGTLRRHSQAVTESKLNGFLPEVRNEKLVIPSGTDDEE